jgi:hypothetical protein
LMCFFTDGSYVKELTCVVLYAREPDDGDLSNETNAEPKYMIQPSVRVTPRGKVKQRALTHLIPIPLDTAQDIFRP